MYIKVSGVSALIPINCFEQLIICVIVLLRVVLNARVRRRKGVDREGEMPLLGFLNSISLDFLFLS